VLIGTAEVELDYDSIASKAPKWTKMYFECQDEVSKEAGAVEVSLSWQFAVPLPCSSPPETDIEGDSDIDEGKRWLRKNHMPYYSLSQECAT
jgi:hypothetical protein